MVNAYKAVLDIRPVGDGLHVTHAEVYRLASATPLVHRLRRERLWYLPRIVRAGPPLLIALLQELRRLERQRQHRRRTQQQQEEL